MRNLVLLGIAFLIAAVTAFLVRERIADTPSQQPVTEQAAMIPVTVASVPLESGMFIRSDKHLSVKSMTEGAAPAGFIPGDGASLKAYDGAVIRRPVAAGDPILSTDVLRPDEGGFMSAVLGADKRAVSIAVNATTGNAGFIFPGDHVDVILTHKVALDEEGKQETIVGETVARDLRVLAVDQRASNVDNKAAPARTVTLEVSPRQAEILNVAGDMGRLSLALRSLPDPNAPKTADEDVPYTLGSDVSTLVPSVARNKQVTVTRGESTSKTEVAQ